MKNPRPRAPGRSFRSPFPIVAAVPLVVLALPSCGAAPADDVGPVAVSSETLAPTAPVRRISPDLERTITNVVSEEQLSGDGYVRAPGGQLVHSSCFYNVPDDAWVDFDAEGDAFVTSATGERTVLPPCAHSSVSVDTDAANSGAAKKDYDGWIEASWYHPQALPTKVDATWTVPPAPTRNSGQNIFFFPGIEGVTFLPIVQPELLFANGKWWIRSEYGPDNRGHYYTSPAKQVKPGDLVHGTAQAIQCTADGRCTWKITSRVAAKKLSSVLNVGRISALIHVIGSALEVYDVSRCDELPGGNPYIWFESLGVWSYTAKLDAKWEPGYYNISPLKCRQLVNTKYSDKVSMYFR